MRRHRNTDRRSLCEDEDRYWSKTSTSQGTPRIAGSHQKISEGHGTSSPLELSKGTNPANTLISDFWPQQLLENKILLFLATQFMIICYSNHRKWIQASSSLINSFWWWFLPCKWLNTENGQAVVLRNNRYSIFCNKGMGGKKG